MMYGFDDYVFVNKDFEKLAECGLADDEVAEKEAEYLAVRHRCRVDCYRLVTTIEPPESEVAK
jgi:hypothetical protein